LIERVFKDNPFRYSTPDKRSNHPHLAGWDRSKMPEFKWPESPAPSERK
jgi:hypothetical protein